MDEWGEHWYRRQRMSESRSWRFVQGQVDSEIKVISTIRKCKPPTTLTVNNNNDDNNTFFAFPQSSEPFNQNGSDLLFGRTRSALFFLFLHFFSLQISRDDQLGCWLVIRE